MIKKRLPMVYVVVAPAVFAVVSLGVSALLHRLIFPDGPIVLYFVVYLLVILALMSLAMHLSVAALRTALDLPPAMRTKVRVCWWGLPKDEEARALSRCACTPVTLAVLLIAQDVPRLLEEDGAGFFWFIIALYLVLAYGTMLFSWLRCRELRKQ